MHFLIVCRFKAVNHSAINSFREVASDAPARSYCVKKNTDVGLTKCNSPPQHKLNIGYGDARTLSSRNPYMFRSCDDGSSGGNRERFIVTNRMWCASDLIARRGAHRFDLVSSSH